MPDEYRQPTEPAVRQRAVRPQLKRDPLGAIRGKHSISGFTMRRFVAVLRISHAAVIATACNRKPQQGSTSEPKLEAPNLGCDTTTTPQAPAYTGSAAARTIEDRVRDIIAQELGVEREKVTANASFADDLGADSLDAVELVMAFEKDFDIDISDKDAEKLRTVGDAIRYLKGRVAGQIR